MKAQFSRISYQANKQYCAVYQQQGRMITDADWNELVAVIKERQQRAGMLSIGSGVPAGSNNKSGRQDIRGVLNITEDRLTNPGRVAVDAKLQWGTVVVDGIHAEVVPENKSISDFNYNNQLLFQQPPSLPASGEVTYYVDVWERLVVSLQDEDLKDPALHGADTCVRTQVLAQIKYAENKDDILDESINPKSGNAEFSLLPAQNTSSNDDPCLADTAIANQSGNYLFRLEVHHVNTHNDIPSQVTLKWSFENAAEAHKIENVPPEFRQDNAHYEFFDDITEQHLGVHLRGAHLQGAAYKIPHLHAVAGYPEDIPKDINNEDYTYVRRWDGYCILKQDAGSWLLAGGKHLGQDIPFSSMQSNGTLTIGLGALEMVLECANKLFVVGDYWLALLRQSEDSQAEPDVPCNLPVGVLHHYLVLGSANLTSAADAYSIKSLSLDDVRQLSFPSLTNICADRVGYDPGVASSRWNDIKDNPAVPNPVTVQDAIDQMANNLEASDITYQLPTCSETDGVPSFKSLIENYIEREDENGDPTDASSANASIKIKSLWDAILCELDAAKIPYDPKNKAIRWEDINEEHSLIKKWSREFVIDSNVSEIGSTVKSYIAIDKKNDIWFVITKSLNERYSTDIYKLNSNGILGSVSLSSTVYVTDIAVDDQANLYITGHYIGSADFSGASNALPNASTESGFLVKLKSNGNYGWSISLANNLESRGQSIEIAEDGSVLLSGYTQGVRPASGSGSNLGLESSSFYLARISTDGLIKWSQEFAGTDSAMGNHLKIYNNTIVIVGYYTGDIDLGGYELSNTTGNTELFIARLTVDGNPVWAKNYSGFIVSTGIALDSQGALILTGLFSGTVNFGGDDLISDGAQQLSILQPEDESKSSPFSIIQPKFTLSIDMFIAKLTLDNADGYEHNWSKSFGSSHIEWGEGVAVDNNDNIMISGTTSGPIDFGGGEIATSGTYDAFLAFFKSDGSYQWATTLADDYEEFSHGLKLDPNGQLIVNGRYVREISSGTVEAKIFIEKYTWENFPLTVQQAIDDLIENLESSDISYVLPGCEHYPSDQSTLSKLLYTKKSWVEGQQKKINDLFDAILCDIDAAIIPYNTGSSVTTVEDNLNQLWAEKVNKSGDTMTGPLIVNSSADSNATELIAIGRSALDALDVSGDCQVNGSMTITGDFTVQGTQTVQPEVLIEDNTITLNKTDSTLTTNFTSGIEVFRGDTVDKAKLLWDEADQEWKLGVGSTLSRIASGTEISTLTDGSNADALHVHSKLYKPDDIATAALSVNTDGNIAIGGQAANADLVIGDEFGASASGGSGGGGLFGSNLATHTGVDLYTPYEHTDNYGYSGILASWGGLKFYSNSGDTQAGQLVTPTPNMVITSSGYIGIGTATPNAELEVNGDVLLSGDGPDTRITGIDETDYDALELHLNNDRNLRIESKFSPNIILGYRYNSVTDGVQGATICGGGTHKNSDVNDHNRSNRVSADFGVVSGGILNTAGNYASIGGGWGNTASGWACTIAGGLSNQNSGTTCAIGGGVNNNVSGNFSTVPGGSNNKAIGNNCFAAGTWAIANHNGAFVWADSTNREVDDFSSTQDNQFLIKANGGVGIGTTDTSKGALVVNGDIHATGNIYAEGVIFQKILAVRYGDGIVEASNTFTEIDGFNATVLIPDATVKITLDFETITTLLQWSAPVPVLIFRVYVDNTSVWQHLQMAPPGTFTFTSYQLNPEIQLSSGSHTISIRWKLADTRTPQASIEGLRSLRVKM